MLFNMLTEESSSYVPRNKITDKKATVRGGTRSVVSKQHAPDRPTVFSGREQLSRPQLKNASRLHHRKLPRTALTLLIRLCSVAGLIFVLVRVYRATILEPANDTEGGLSSVLVSFKQPVKEQQSQPQQKQQTRSFDQLALNAHPVDEPPHYHTLQCQDYGGPNEKEAQEMVYWQDIPSDTHYVSPFHAKKGERRQYMTFEPDGGGWNNIRMAMETVVGLAIATGRTLVLPPEQRMYLLGQGRGKQKTDFSFMDFFPMQELAKDNDGLTMITMQEFLNTEALTGNLFYKDSRMVAFPPGNETDWNGKDMKVLKEWLRNVTYTPLWSPSKCLAVFPASGEHKDAAALQEMVQKIELQGFWNYEVLKDPLPVDATTRERMRESLAQRHQLCLYNEQMQSEFVVHFMCYHKLRVRMLVHFYAFLFFEDWREDLWMKRFMRDHMRYIDEMQCAAARIVSAIRKRAREHNKKNLAGDFDTFHIRRGDFQYKDTRISADEIYKNVKDILTEGATVYIATDERDLTFFAPLRTHYNLLFMDDFRPQLRGVNKNYFGMIDQLVASRGRYFFGCWHSTFTGFINRMRGYHSVREKLAGHADGLLPNTYYYVPKGRQLDMHSYAPLHGAFFNREFPTSWRQLDKGIGNLPAINDH